MVSHMAFICISLMISDLSTFHVLISYLHIFIGETSLLSLWSTF